jgi:hypothetical protein
MGAHRTAASEMMAAPNFGGNEMALSNTAQPQVPAKGAAQCRANPLWQEGCARLKWMVSASMRASILVVVGLAVGGCAQFGRLAAVSAEETGRATVPGQVRWAHMPEKFGMDAISAGPTATSCPKAGVAAAAANVTSKKKSHRGTSTLRSLRQLG